jgi:anthranilate phosphoribosyltransferase
MDNAPKNPWSHALGKLVESKDLTALESSSVMEEILTGLRSQEEIAEFLSSHTKKSGTAEEVSGFIEAMYAHAAPISISERAVDTVGTGGDGFHTINISTTAAIVAASAGARVIKHGNRAATSKSGAADVLEALGVKIDLDGGKVATLFSELGLGFCFAPIFHAAMRHAGPARKSLGYPTIFNILGPLSNPAKPAAYSIGVASEKMFPIVAEVLRARGVDALVFRGRDGLDEITLSTVTDIFVIGNKKMISTSIDPQELGISRSGVEALRGGSAGENAAHLREILRGKQAKMGPMRDVVLLNAAATLIAFDGVAKILSTEKSGKLEEAFSATLVKVTDAVDSGAANDLLDRWIARSHLV